MGKATEVTERVPSLLERMAMNEMATLASRKKGAPFDLIVYGGSEHYPPHIHIQKDGKLITRLVIPNLEMGKEPTLDDLTFLKGDGEFSAVPPNTFKKQILSLLKSRDTRGNLLWSRAVIMWDSLQPDLPFDDFNWDALDQYILK